MQRRPFRCALLVVGVVLAGCGGSDDPADTATTDQAAASAAEAADDTQDAAADESEDAADSDESGGSSDLSGIDACAVLTDEAIDEALTAQIGRELTVTVERTPGTSDTEELGGPQRLCSFGVSDEGGYYSWDLRIVSLSYFDEQKLFSDESQEVPPVAGADEVIGSMGSDVVWARAGDVAISIQNSSATQGLSVRLIEQVISAL